VWTRSFAGGATKVELDTGGSTTPCTPDTAGAWTIANTAQYFTLISSNASVRVYNLSCTTACSTSWHTATATMSAPFTSLHIVFHMQPGFKPVQDNGVFDASCSVIEYSGSDPWCAPEKNPTCSPKSVKTSCIRWSSGATTGNAC
jgi:hypothetical protein